MVALRAAGCPSGNLCCLLRGVRHRVELDLTELAGPHRAPGCAVRQIVRPHSLVVLVHCEITTGQFGPPRVFVKLK